MQGAEGGGLSHNIQLAKVNYVMVKINVSVAIETEKHRMEVKLLSPVLKGYQQENPVKLHCSR